MLCGSSLREDRLRETLRRLPDDPRVSGAKQCLFSVSSVGSKSNFLYCSSLVHDDFVKNLSPLFSISSWNKSMEQKYFFVEQDYGTTVHNSFPLKYFKLFEVGSSVLAMQCTKRVLQLPVYI